MHRRSSDLGNRKDALRAEPVEQVDCKPVSLVEGQMIGCVCVREGPRRESVAVLLTQLGASQQPTNCAASGCGCKANRCTTAHRASNETGASCAAAAMRTAWRRWLAATASSAALAPPVAGAAGGEAAGETSTAEAMAAEAAAAPEAPAEAMAAAGTPESTPEATPVTGAGQGHGFTLAIVAGVFAALASTLWLRCRLA